MAQETFPRKPDDHDVLVAEAFDKIQALFLNPSFDRNDHREIIFRFWVNMKNLGEINTNQETRLREVLTDIMSETGQSGCGS